MSFKRTEMAAAVTLALSSMAVGAQTAAAPVTTIEVTGIRASLEQSLNQRRAADSRVDVITAEDIGKMPDKNIADSLQRLPGVTISSAGANEGGFDENDRVSMRGTNPSLTQTLVNGHNLASGDWFVLNQTTNAGRSVSYSLLPSELVGRVEVHKSSKASLVEGGAVGTVIVHTRKPLEFKKDLTLEGSLGLVHADLPGKTDPQISGLLAWKNPERTFGVLLNAFSQTRHLRRDGVEILGYNQIKPGSAVANSNPDLAGVWYPRSIGAALFEQERERTGGLVDVQFKPNKDLSFDLSAFTSTLKASNYNRNWLLHAPFFLNEGAGQAPKPGYVVRNNTLVSAEFAADPSRFYGTYDQLSRPGASAEADFVNLDANWRVSDDLRLSAKLGVSKGRGATPTQDQASWDIRGGAFWHLNGVNRAPDFGIGTPANSPTGSVLDWLWGAQNVVIDDEDRWAQLDGELDTQWGAVHSIKFGLRLSKHERSSANVVAQGPRCGDGKGFNWGNPYFCHDDSTSPFNPANFPQGYKNYPGDFGSNLGGNFPRDVWYYTEAQLKAFDNKYTTRDPVLRRYFDWEFALEEQSDAAYVQADFESGALSGNFGVRLVETKESVLQYLPVNPVTPGAINTSLFGAYLPVVTENSHSDVLPSLNLKYKFSRELEARFALSRTLTRPDFSALAAATSLSPPAAPGDVGSGSSSNPNLKPIRSTNLDLTFDYYFAPKALASFGLFHMNLDNYISLGQVTRSFKTFNQANPSGFMADYVLTVPVNSEGTVKGFELAYQQPFGANFGVAANYTYTDAEEEGGKPLVGASKNSFNLSPYFENEKYNVRLNYTYRSSFYSGLDRSTAFSQAGVANLSASLGYKISDRMTLSFDAMNLNDPKLKYYALNHDQPRSIYENGRQYYLTLRVKL